MIIQIVPCSMIVLMMMMPRTALLAHNDDYPQCTMFHECSDDDDDAKAHLAGPDSPSLKEGGLRRVRVVQEGGSPSEKITNSNNNFTNDINNIFALTRPAIT